MSSKFSASFTAVSKLLDSAINNASHLGYRAAVVLSGEREWGLDLMQAVLPAFHLPRTLWLGDLIPPEMVVLEKSEGRRQLGQELDGVILDAYAGFDAEIFGAAVGALRAGGLFVLLSPPLDSWHDYPDPEHARLAITPVEPGAITGRFLQHIAKVLQGSPDIYVIRQGQAVPDIARLQGREWQPPWQQEGVTVDQRLAVEAIRHVARGHRHRPLVLTSDRGRGKSTALGVAAAQLLQEGMSPILVTAPRLAAVEQVFAHAERCLQGAERSRGELAWQGKKLAFVAPDALTRQSHKAALLLVDEAAAIPTGLLERMLTDHARVVFASTIHGYEGTGRGFAVRFFRVLDARTPGWRLQRLTQPVRWAEGDPLERFSFRALLLDAEPASDADVAEATPQHCVFEQLDRDVLLQDETTLVELFGLLVLAHYRTSPDDLRYLLDGPNLRICTLRYGKHVVATALVAREGGLPPELAQAIYEGRRRAHGHLMPQSLAVHAGFAEAPVLRADRVVRIAVHPALQRRGLGSKLLQHVRQQAQQSGADYLGASFGATEKLLDFWQGGGLLPVRVGLTREASSGTHSVMVMQPLTPAGETLFAAVQTHLAGQLPLLLGEPLADVEAALAVRVFPLLPLPEARLTDQDWHDVRSFAETLRGYEVCLPALWRLAGPVLSAASFLTKAQRKLLLEKVLQRRGWKAVADAHGMSGRAEALASLREVYRRILEHYRPPVG